MQSNLVTWSVLNTVHVSNEKNVTSITFGWLELIKSGIRLPDVHLSLFTTIGKTHPTLAQDLIEDFRPLSERRSFWWSTFQSKIGWFNLDPFYINSEFEKTFSQQHWWNLIIVINEFSCLEQVNSENFNGDREGIFLI